MSNLLFSLLFLSTFSVSHAQDIPDLSTQWSQSPTYIIPFTSPEPTGKPSLPPFKGPISTSSPTDSECANDPGWYYEYWEYSGCPFGERKIVNLSCDDDRVTCWDSYGNLGWAQSYCCKCKFNCSLQCNDPITALPTSTADFGVNCSSWDDYHPYSYGDDYHDEFDGEITTFTGIAIFICCCFLCCLLSCNKERQHDASLEANRQTMATRRQEQRQSNSQGLTEDERNNARYELFKSKFHFQTVLPDKSNISANSLRNSATKPGEEHDDASAIGTSERPMKSSLSRRLSSWRRPSAKDECCICLECYNVGETICAPITTECDHVFHEGCILQWVKNNDKCPLCRVELLKERRSDDDVHA